MTKLRHLFLFVVFSVLHSQVLSQILPKEGSTLNYRIIGFAFPRLKNANKYTIEIALGNYADRTAFEKNIIKTLIADTNRIIVEVPSFGVHYTWSILDKNRTASKQHSKLYHFSTATTPNVDTGVKRLKIVQEAIKYQDSYIFLDGTRTLYDMNGAPVWFLPDADSLDSGDRVLRDLKLSPQGTITFLSSDNIFEVNYDGKILWKGPSNSNNNIRSIEDSPAHYHHQFNRLHDGHYMTMGYNYLPWKTDSSSSGLLFIDPKNATKQNQRTEFGTILEYDSIGRIVWFWTSASYYSKLWSYYHNIPTQGSDYATHENSFFFDEEHNNIYVSFKNISQILKVKYPEGNVLNVYGSIAIPGVSDSTNGLFYFQHSCSISHDGYLCLFNNGCDSGAPPQVIMMREPLNDQDSLKLMWEYRYPLDIANSEWSGARKRVLLLNPMLTHGGNVTELSDGSFFISSCDPFSSIFIVSRSKQVLWAANSQRYKAPKKKWIPMPQYRASIIPSRQELEHLIWNKERDVP